MAEVIIPDIMKTLKAVSHSNADNLHIVTTKVPM